MSLTRSLAAFLLLRNGTMFGEFFSSKNNDIYVCPCIIAKCFKLVFYLCFSGLPTRIDGQYGRILDLFSKPDRRVRGRSG